MSAEDEDMSNVLMNDMADALRSAGLGSMVAEEEAPEPEHTEDDLSLIHISEPTRPY